jgi:hypothetical protein
MPAGQVAQQRTIRRTRLTSAIEDLWVAGLVWRAPRADVYDGHLQLSVAPLMAAAVFAESRIILFARWPSRLEAGEQLTAVTRDLAVVLRRMIEARSAPYHVHVMRDSQEQH